ncbi:hypothetical protein ACFW9D_05410 [Streptomyces sp. NPDC059524]|uniref:hypothetical protein n=1 Tax=Streptomyces sp. NPDC059524 TaxID=3346856 RepID=UPI0036CDD67F
MNDDSLALYVRKVIATAELAQIEATVDDLGHQVDRELTKLAAMDRFDIALPELERLEALYPGRSSTRELMEDAGVTCEGLGLHETDPELLDEMMREMAQQ